jgi:uncharacterized protein (TIGR02284 family)
MTSGTKNIEDIVNPVIEICRDGEQGFATAANAVENNALRQDLSHYSKQRAGFAAALANALEEIGEEPVTHGSVSGALHRGWINITKMKPGDNEHAVLVACERGEGSAGKTYTEALGASLPTPIADLLAAQFQLVKATHDRIRNLRDAAENN